MIKRYGLQWDEKKVDDFKIELAMYALQSIRDKGRPLSKWEHLRNAIKMVLPEHVFAWHKWVDSFGEAWCEETEIVVWGAGGTTKSGIVGCLSLFDLMAKPKSTLTVMVTNPQEKHWDRCFSKTIQWRAALPKHLQIGKMVISPKPALLTQDLTEGSRRGILCISIDKGDSAQDIGKKVGAHAPNTRLILEEGQALPTATLDIATNLFMGSVDKKEVVIGNPGAWTGNALGEASTPMSGDTSVIDKEMPDSWLLRRTHGDRPGKALVFDGLKCPTHDSPEEAKRLSFMIQPRDISSAMEKPGAENTPNFWSQIRGRIPPAGQILVVFQDIDWEIYGVSSRHEWFKDTKPELFTSADLSLGGDKIPVYLWGIGLTEAYGKVAQKLNVEYIMVNVSLPNRSKQIGTAYAKILKRWQVGTLANCSADCSGQQGAIADRMEESCHELGIPGLMYRVRSEEAVTERRLSNGKVMRTTPGKEERERACDRYKDRATELVMNLPEAIEARLIWGLDAETKRQLCTRGYDEISIEMGKTKVQKKKEWIEANKGQSPDELDAVCVGLAHFFERRILVPGIDTVPKHVEKSDLPTWMIPGQRSMAPPITMRASRVASVMRRR